MVLASPSVSDNMNWKNSIDSSLDKYGPSWDKPIAIPTLLLVKSITTSWDITRPKLSVCTGITYIVTHSSTVHVGCCFSFNT